MKVIFFLLTMFLFSTCVSCDEPSIINENKSIDNRSWLSTSQPKFKFHIDDTSKRYTVFLNVRHTPQYPFSNLSILLHELGMNGRKTTFRKDIQLARSDGSWIGTSAGSLYMNKSLIHKSYTFPDTGFYQISVEQNMYNDPLQEITDIGIQVVPE